MLNTPYFQAIKQFVNDDKLSKPEDPVWESLPMPTSLDLLVAGRRISDTMLGTMFRSVSQEGVDLVQRPPKTMKRVIDRATTSRPKINPFFKMHCDFSGFYLPCLARDLPVVVSALLRDMEKLGGKAHVEVDVTQGASSEKKRDIVQRVFAYCPVISPSIIEFWIGHPFALATFTLNSLRREDESIKAALPNVFANGLYDRIKGKILEENGWDGLFWEPILTALKEGGFTDENLDYFYQLFLPSRFVGWWETWKGKINSRESHSLY